MSNTKPFTANRNGHTDLETVLDWKILIIGEAVSANEEAAATFPVEFKKLIRIKYCLRFPHPAEILECFPGRYEGTTVF